MRQSLKSSALEDVQVLEIRILVIKKIAFESNRKDSSFRISKKSGEEKIMKAFLQSHWKLVPGINLLLGVALWFGSFTDISLRGTIPDILFPPFVAVLALISLGIIPTEKKKFGMLANIPSVGGGCLYMLMAFIMLAPPFTLAFLFDASEIAGEVRIQQIASPNNINFAEVYFRPVGAYTGGNGRIYIRVVNKYIPVIERDIYAGKTHTADEKTTNYVQWLDKNTLYIAETGERMSIGNIKSELPSIAFVPIMVAGFIQGQVKESQLTAPLRDIPIYPAMIEHESTSYWDVLKTGERIYLLPESHIKQVYDWYLSNLSEAPWEIIDSQTTPYPYSDPIYEGHDAYCITAQKHDGNQITIYYFEISEDYGPGPDINPKPASWNVRVIASTPNPDGTVCWLK